MADNLIMTTAIKKMLKMKARYRVVQGGTSASKTFGILAILIQEAISERAPLLITVVSESIPHLKGGAINDFTNIMIMMGIYDDANFNHTDKKYKFPNGSIIEFEGGEKAHKFRGLRRDILYVNEATGVSYDVFQELTMGRTKFETWIDFNPSSRFWVHKQIVDDDKVDCDFIKLTYKDNEALSQNQVDEIEVMREKGKTDPYFLNKWNVYGLGEIGGLEGVCIDNWSQLDELPEYAELLCIGLDWGFSNDPMAMVGMYKCNGTYVFDEMIYSTGLRVGEVWDYIEKNNLQKSLVYADCSDASSINEVNTLGGYRNIIPCEKSSKITINFGIDMLASSNIMVTARSKNIITELQNYVWRKDKMGGFMNVAKDEYNHAIDAMRYAITMYNKNKHFGSYHLHM